MPRVEIWHGNFFMHLMKLNHGTKQPLDSRQLFAFVTLAKTGGFTLAGKELFLSQSAISHSIKALETEIDCRLFDRVGKKIRLTPAGEHLLHYAEKILTDMSGARTSIEQLGKWGQGRLRAGVPVTICQFLLPSVLRDFRREFPEWPVSVETADTRASIDHLRHGRLDLAIAIAPNRAEPVEIVPLFSDELAWIVSADHPWAKKNAVQHEEISSQHFIFNNAMTYTFHLVEKHFQRNGIRPKLALELGCLEALKEMVRDNMGITVLAPWVVRKEVKEKSLVALPLGRKKLRRNWCILRSLDRKPNLAEETFVKLAVAAAKSLNLGG